MLTSVFLHDSNSNVINQHLKPWLTSFWCDSSCAPWFVQTSWTPCRRSCRCRPWCPKAPYGVLPSAETAGSEEQTHLHTLRRSDSAEGKTQNLKDCTQSSSCWVCVTFHDEPHLFFLVQHNMGFEASDAWELFIAHRAGEVRSGVCGLV